MDIPSLFMIPSAVSSGKVHSVFPNSTDADFDFNRDSDATRVNSEGLIERVGYYGSELVTNGGFDTDSNWSKTSGATISNGKATITVTGGGYQSVAQSISLSNTKKYRLTAVVNGTSGKAATFVDNSANNGGLTTSNGVITFNGQDQNVDITWTANSNSFEIEIIRNGSGDFSFTVDNVSVKELTGDRARLNYEIEGGLVNTKPSLLLEPSRTNIFLNSNDLSQWLIGAGLTVTTNLVTSPDGTKNADQIKKTSENYTYIRQSLATGSVSVFSIFVKQGNYRYIGIRNNDSGHSVFDFETKTFVTSKADHNLSFEELPNGWFRLIDERTISTNTNAFRGVALTLADGIELSSDIPLNAFAYIWGGQLENGATYSTSFIPTNGSAQTRSGETCNGAGTSSILPSEEGILYAEIAALHDSGHQYISINDGSTNNRVTLELYPSAGTLVARLTSGGVQQAFLVETSINKTNYNKIAVRFKLDYLSFWVNGVMASYDATNVAIPIGLSEVDFNQGSNSGFFYGKIRDIRVYNTKEMTDSEVDILLTKITS